MNAPQHRQKEQALYRYLYEYSQEYGYTPSFQEMVDHTGARTKSHVAYQLKNLEAAGWIEKTPNTPRAIRLTREIFRPQVSAPIQLVGVIQAGAPIPIPGSDFAFFLPDDAIEVGGMLPPQARKKDLYALRVEGDSMIDSNVQDRDIVIMEPTREARNGDMVAAWLIMKEETTLKHFYKEKDHVKLKPANPSYPTQTYRPNEIEVHGRVMMVIRSC